VLSGAVHDVLLHALESGSVPGLDPLFAAHSVEDVEKWVVQLAGESARLDRIAANAGDLGDFERPVLALAVEARREADRRLTDAGAVDFDRMIVWTRDLLRDDTLARGLLQRRIGTLIVD